MSPAKPKRRFSAAAAEVLRKAWRSQIQHCIGCKLAKKLKQKYNPR